MSKAPFLAGAILSLLGAGVIAEAMRLPTIPGQTYGPGFFPVLIGAGLLVFGAIYALSVRRPMQAVILLEGEGTAPDEAEETVPERPFYGALAWLVTGLVATIFLWETAGFVLLMSVVLTVFMILLGVRFWHAGLVSIASTIIVYALFIKILMVPLPAGLLAPLGL
ncbi:tripartite tricarboxylate transporter TctB family protein [Microvirga vignae]|uniref:tripartite tricarboxylate transporter TctB family protein n=1 Tax=Microvirga vignae TaxID=1225564 RepID=UPI00069B1F1F|nr:tripartite tricarboxylate transporter TctB family protein [Microvirga vignae]